VSTTFSTSRTSRPVMDMSRSLMSRMRERPPRSPP
jgi:hypothetical protein